MVELDALIVSSSRLEAAESAANRLSAANLSLFENDEVGDQLELVPGLQTIPTDGTGARPEVYVNGGEPSFTVVSVEGIRLNDPTSSRGGAPDFALVDPWHVKVIEVAAGGNSAVLGADALNGAIGFRLFDPAATDEAVLRARMGENGAYKLGGEVKASAGNTAWAAGVSFFDAGEPSPLAAFEALRGYAASAFTLGAETSVSAAAFFADVSSAGFPDDSGGPLYAVRREAETREVTGAGASISLDHNWDDDHVSAVTVSIFHYTDLVDSPGVAPGPRDPMGIVANRFEQQFDRWSLEYLDRWMRATNWSALWGVSMMREVGSSDSVLFFPGFDLPGGYSMDRNTFSLFGEGRFDLSRDWSLVGGLRGTSSEESDQRLSPRVALAFNPVDLPYRAELSWGTGFKDPSFFALANPLVGNPELVPEKSESLRARWELVSEAGERRLGLTLFHDQFEDLIDFFPGPPPQMRNIGGVTLRGIQLEAQWTATRQLRFFGHLSWQDWEVENSGDVLLLRPTWLGTAGAEYRPNERMRASLVQRWVGEREDSSVATGDRQLPAFLTTDLMLEIGVTAQWSLRLMVENLFDREAEVRVGLPAAGRRLKMQTGVVF